VGSVVVVPGPWSRSLGSRPLLGGLGLRGMSITSHFRLHLSCQQSSTQCCCLRVLLLVLTVSVLVFTSSFCHVCSLCDGKPYSPSLHATVSLYPALSCCTVAVAIHCWVDLCSGYSRCCSSRVFRRLKTTSGRSWPWSWFWSTGLACIADHGLN